MSAYHLHEGTNSTRSRGSGDLDLSIVAAVNDEEILARNLLQSPVLRSGQTRLHVYRNQPSAACAYNLGLEETDSELIAFVHQDVYLPTSWLAFLQRAVSVLNIQDPDWAVLGVYGLGRDGRHVGQTWSSGLGCELGRPLPAPTPVVGVDELAFVLRRAAGCSFDARLPGFHLYGTDIVQTACSKGKGAYVANLPVVHNSRTVRVLNNDYVAAYRYMQRKWWTDLPIPTSTILLTRSSIPLVRARLRSVWSSRARMRKAVASTTDPKEIALRLGYD